MNIPLSPDDICLFITGRLLGCPAAGRLPWKETRGPGVPEYALTGAPFTGINVLLLWQAMQQLWVHSEQDKLKNKRL
ncbi:hypothetical protein HG597_20210 [Klebsiella sp. DNRA6]|uniref:ArdC-like ssDNA-binding domain-containing protein n=1 Tax=Klebsiella sp. DNRA6 TaxID=2723057 RepID=UPI001475BF9D|nr:ArdC-like ssDNA-binding domain-containing protein [Klebsiella sp. DNRA6]NMD81430.1 hypothetical protein [Klebsiella sp. DNRA6]